MISIKFVKLSREVIQFIRNGNRLTYSQFIYDYRNKSACALGAVSYNHERCSMNFVKDYLGLNSEFAFYCGYDDFFILNTKLDQSETIRSWAPISGEYEMGFKFAQMVLKRGWVDEK